MADILFGKQPTTETFQQDPINPAGFDFAEIFWNQIVPMLLQQQLPTFPGQVNPGLSPFMQSTMNLGAAQHGQSIAPYMQAFNGTMGASAGALPQVGKPPGNPNAGGWNPWAYSNIKTAGGG